MIWNYSQIIRSKVDVLMISEAKLDSSLPEEDFYMESYSKPYRLRCEVRGSISNEDTLKNIVRILHLEGHT